MPNDSSKLFQQLQPAIHQDFLRMSQKREDTSQYRVGAIPAHTHNNIDSLPVNFAFLGGVKKYLVSNTLTLSSAQIKALFTTPIVLIPPPAARSVVIVHSVTARLTYGGTAYTGTHNMQFSYTDGSGTQVTDSIPAAFINSTSSAFYHAPAVASSFAPIEGGSGPNGQIVVSVNTANPATGNSTITLVIHYHLVSFVT